MTRSSRHVLTGWSEIKDCSHINIVLILCRKLYIVAKSLGVINYRLFILSGVLILHLVLQCITNVCFRNTNKFVMEYGIRSRTNRFEVYL